MHANGQRHRERYRQALGNGRHGKGNCEQKDLVQRHTANQHYPCHKQSCHTDQNGHPLSELLYPDQQRCLRGLFV